MSQITDPAVCSPQTVRILHEISIHIIVPNQHSFLPSRCTLRNHSLYEIFISCSLKCKTQVV